MNPIVSLTVKPTIEPTIEPVVNADKNKRLNGSVLGGVALLALILAGSVYAVNHFRRPGSMTPIEVQAMDMNLPAPAGVAPVELATVETSAMDSRVRYSGQAVGYLEQEVTARVTGTLVWMELYAGDRVSKGQVIARLDTSQSAPQVANQIAGLDMAKQSVAVAEKEYQQTLAGVKEAHAEGAMKTQAIAGARAELKAAEEEKANMQAALEAAESMRPDADAQLQAARADQRYWKSEIERESGLLKAGAVTQEEYQREKAQADNADSRVRQAEARLIQVEAQVRGAQSALRKASAMISAAQSKVDETRFEQSSHEAHVVSAQAMAAAARQKIALAQTGVAQARATLMSANASRAYSEIRAQSDGVVTQRLLSPGTLVSPGQTILRIAQIDPIRLQANVSEADLARLQVGDPVEVTLSFPRLRGDRGGLSAQQDQERGESNPAGRSIKAKISSIAPAVDAAAHTGIVETILPNTQHSIVPGQYVTISISVVRKAKALSIPTRAIRYHAAPSDGTITTQTRPWVWSATPTGNKGSNGMAEYTVQETPVEVGLSDSSRTEILKGLEVGQQVVLVGQDDLKNGDTVAQIAPASGAVAHSDADRHPGIGQMQPGQGSGSVRQPGASHTLYTCMMHPEIVQDHPGDCPKCGMKLIPKRTGGGR